MAGSISSYLSSQLNCDVLGLSRKQSDESANQFVSRIPDCWRLGSIAILFTGIVGVMVILMQECFKNFQG